MRKLLALMVPLALLAGAQASARTSADGTLSVREARGLVQLSARGSVTGRFERGKIAFTDSNPYDSRRPVVYGRYKASYISAKTTVYTGQNIRFRFLGTSFHVKVEGRGIFLSAIGRGAGLMQGAGNPSSGVFFDGVWSLNEQEYRSLPDELTRFQLVAPSS